MSDFFVLDDDHNLIPADVRTWAEWMQNNTNRLVAQTQLGNIFVSTVCLGIDHNFTRIGPAHLFETMIFIDGKGGDVFRCATWAEAEAQHARTVGYVTQFLAQDQAELVELEANDAD